MGITIQSGILVFGVGLLTTISAITDWQTRRIPNALTVPIFVAGLVYQAYFGGWQGLSDAGLAFLIGFGTLFVLWAIGGGGGGDAKLMGALSVWLGFMLTLYVLVLSTILVAASSMLSIVYNFIALGPFRAKRRMIATEAPTAKGGKKKPVSVEEKQKRRLMPFAIPVALATWVVMYLRWPLV